ncbi:MAG: ADP-ribosylglycohydrolase family protein [Nitrososphaeria archaeon]
MDRLFSKLYGCEAACAIGNSMGDVTEGLDYKEIEDRYGFLQELLPQDKKGGIRPAEYEWGLDLVYYAHHRPPGMTEDGMERHRICASAIIKKGGRINIIDLAKEWLELIDPKKFGYLLGPQDQIIYYSIKAGIPPWEIGKYASWPGFIGTTKMIIPVGEVNACNPKQAAQDAFELGRLKDVRGVPGNYALEVCAGVAAGVAEALKPNASVESIIDVILSYLSRRPKAEVEQILSYAREVKDWRELRPLYDYYFKSKGRPISDAVDVLAGALACFLLAKGQPKEAILYAVNLGRDTDCKAYIAGGLAGALNGIDAIPKEWVQIVEEEVINDPYTVYTKTCKEIAEGLYKAVLNTMKEMQDSVNMISMLLSS